MVAILDADKEGFLRSETSLIQTIGRAARNDAGKVIMYADHITNSMERALSETNRRRAIQMAYNEEHGITPETIKKAVRGIIESKESAEREGQKTGKSFSPKNMSLDDLITSIAELEREMKKAAKDLDFERAAEMRDEIARMKKFLPDAKWTQVPTR